MLQLLVVAIFVGVAVSHGEARGLAATTLDVVELMTDSELFKVADVIMSNGEDLEPECIDSLLQEFGSIKACGNLTHDVAQIGMLVTSAVQQVVDFSNEAGVLLGEFNACAFKSILKKVKCYKNFFADFQAAVSKYEEEAIQVVQEAKTVVFETVSDMKMCFHRKGFSSELVERKIKLCKLNLL